MKLLNNALKNWKKTFSSKEQLLLEVDEIVTSHGFHVSKPNGSKDYIYLQCSRFGKISINNNQKKIDKNSKKTGNYLLMTLWCLIDCKFRISYKFDKASGCYDFNETKANFQHSHPLDYKGLSKRKKMAALEYMAKSELQSKSRLKDITQKTQAFIQGQANDHLIELQKQQNAYLVKKTKEKIWGLPQKDAENLNKLMEQIKNQFPDGLIKMQVDELGQLRNFIFSSSNMKYEESIFKI